VPIYQLTNLSLAITMRNTPSARHTIAEELKGILFFLGAIWIVFILDRFLPLEKLALYPRHLSGLPGIFVSPFLHQDFSHIVSNTIPLLALLSLMAGSRADSRKTVVLIIVVSGSLLWLFGRPVAVIGASGLVFGLIAFLILSGILERRLLAMLVSLFVGISYGSTLIAGILPGQQGISWDGHLFGAIAGGLCAWLLTHR